MMESRIPKSLRNGPVRAQPHVAASPTCAPPASTVLLLQAPNAPAVPLQVSGMRTSAFSHSIVCYALMEFVIFYSIGHTDTEATASC